MSTDQRARRERLRRRRRRQRALALGVAAVAAVGAGVGVAASLRGGGGRHAAATHASPTSAATVVSLSTPSVPSATSGPATAASAAAPPATSTAATTPAATRSPAYRATVTPLPAALRARMIGHSWKPGCPVGLSDLRLVTLRRFDWDGHVRSGELVVAAGVAQDLARAFGTLFRLRYPIRRMQPVDDYGADDYRSIEADNTSAFNCRPATGSTRWSEHAFGRAIDLNPIENPYVDGSGGTAHRASMPYLDRRRAKGVVVAGDAVVRAFTAIGWGWGGTWGGPTDYQHFSSSGR